MKNLIYISLAAIAFLAYACDLNDTLNDDVIVGNMAPHVYWEVGSSTVTAGNSVPFTVQYYTTANEDIDRLEVWYDVVEDEAKTVTCPWTQTFSYSVVSTKSMQKRISQKINEYPHVATNWSDSLRAFTFKSTFPTSNTLATTSWVKPASYDNDKMLAYFGSAFVTQFKDSLFKLMKVTDFQKMYQGLNLVENFKIYMDSVKNDNTGGWTYTFPKDAQGNRPVPQTIIDIYKNIPFSDLIFNKSTNVYEVEYVRSYKINALMKTFDKKNTMGISLSSEISLN